ncbi:MAG: DUF3618 domain-containing protein [Candidatus Eremiobacteraeota bacterium]|nr:DUF3618 domain-containing protein [Candidatus Eremiobacteraeota bacterium]
MGKDSSEIRRKIEETRDRMGDTVDALAYKSDVPNRVKDSISDKVEGVKTALSGAASKVTGSVTGGASRVGDSMSGDMKYGARRAVGMAVENPIGLMVGGLAAGFLAGLMFPATRLENEKIGQVADDLKEQIKATGQEAMEHGKSVVQDIAQAAGQAASQSAGQHGQDLAGSAKERAADIAGSVKNAMPNGSERTNVSTGSTTSQYGAESGYDTGV